MIVNMVIDVYKRQVCNLIILSGSNLDAICGECVVIKIWSLKFDWMYFDSFLCWCGCKCASGSSTAKKVTWSIFFWIFCFAIHVARKIWLFLPSPPIANGPWSDEYDNIKSVSYTHLDVYKRQDPKIEKEDDIIVKVTSTAICGSDLHLVHGLVKGMYDGYVLGHETMGIVEEAGKEVKNLKKGDRVVIPLSLIHI